ncbi:MAG: universal stress protein [Methyloligellaceae bacterium]
MSIKRILLPIDDMHDDKHVADAAFSVAQNHDAEIQGLLAQPHDWQNEWFDSYGLSASELAELNAQVKQKAQEAIERATKAFDVHASRHPMVTSEFHSHEGRMVDIVTRHAYAADLTVIGTQGNFGDHFWFTVSDSALFRSGHPVLVVPSRPVHDNLGSRILIAWKDGKEAARAVSASLPFIARAQEVSLVTVTDDEDFRRSLETMEKYLSLHRADVTLNIIKPGDAAIGKTLVDAAAEKPGTILVMGAYGRRRWEERIFGGATEYVLNNTDVPVLMAH